MQRLRGPDDSIIFPTTGQKDPVTRKFLRLSHNGLAPEDSNRPFSQVWFANFNLCYPWSSKSRGVSSSKERTGLSYGKNQLCFWSISLLFISAQALALGNYTEWKRTSTSTDTSPTKRTHFDSCVCVHACIGPFSRWNKRCDAFVCACVARENQAQQKVMILATGSLRSITFQGF